MKGVPVKVPKVMRPIFPEGYVENPIALLSWEQVVQRLIKAQNYWLCTVQPNGRAACHSQVGCVGGRQTLFRWECENPSCQKYRQESPGSGAFGKWE